MTDTNKNIPLSHAFLALENSSEVRKFLRDILTPQEFKVMEERWAIAQMLYRRDCSYREISSLTGTSVTTVTRVARFLNTEPYKGYKTVLDRLSDMP